MTIASQLYADRKSNSKTSDYRDLVVEFEHAAARFKAEYHRPAVLFIDVINLIASKDPQLLYRLQMGAKGVADNGSYKVIFVCSDGVVPDQFERKLHLFIHCHRHRTDQSVDTMADTATGSSSMSRACVTHIGDHTADQAMMYLTSARNVPEADAVKILGFCGNRILKLRIACDHVVSGRMSIDGLFPCLGTC